MLAHLSLSISFALLHFRVESAAHESRQRTWPVFLAARTTRGTLRCSFRSGLFWRGSCPAEKARHPWLRPFALLRAICLNCIPLLGSSDGKKAKARFAY